MDYIKSFVAANGVNLLNTAASRLGLGYSTRLALLNGFSSLMTGTFGAAIAVAMFPSLYLYSVINNLNVSVPNWISDGVSWVINTLRPAWYGVVNGVQSWQSWYNNRRNDILNVISSIFGDWQSVFSRVRWLWDNGYNLIVSLLNYASQWIWDRLPQWVRDLLAWSNDARQYLQKIISAGVDNLIYFAQHPLEVIWNLFPKILRDAWSVLTDDLQYLVWLFTTAKRYLVEFLNDPQAFIKAHILEPLLDWISEAISEAW